MFVQKQKLSLVVTALLWAYSFGIIPLAPDEKNIATQIPSPFLSVDDEKSNGTPTATSLAATEK